MVVWFCVWLTKMFGWLHSLGRSLILSDELLIREMRQNLEKNDYRFGILVETIVTSPQFLNKRGSGYLIEQISDLSKP